MNACEVIQVIRTTLTRRGEGKSDDDPVRIITQYWETGGTLLWETDPCSPALRNKELQSIERTAELRAFSLTLALIDDVRSSGGDFDALIERVQMERSEAGR